MVLDLVDDTLPDAICSLQAIAHVLSNGSSDDVCALMGELSRICHVCPDGLFDQILPSFCTAIPKWDLSLQRAAGAQLLDFLRSTKPNALAAKLIALCALRVVLPIINNASAMVCELLTVFGDVLADSLALASWEPDDCVRIFSLVDEYSGSDLEDDRLLAVKVLRGLSLSTLPEETLTSSIVSRLCALLPDSNPFITASILEALVNLTTTISKRKFFERIWPKMLRLCDPAHTEDGFAKSTVVSAIGNLLSREENSKLFAHPNQLKLVTFFQQLCTHAHIQTRSDTEFLSQAALQCFATVSANIPKIMMHLSNHGVTHWHKDGLKAYSSLSACTDLTVRATCATNLPVVCAAYRGKSTSTLTRVAEGFSADESPTVRRAYASVYEEIILQLATHSSGNQFNRMLQVILEDPDRSIPFVILDSLGSILKALSALKNNRANELRLGEILAEIASCDEWRMRESLAAQLGIAAKTFSERQQQDVLHILRDLFGDSVAPVRKAAGASYMSVIRVIRDTRLRCACISAFFDEFCTASASLRLSIIDTLFNAAEIFSTHAFDVMFSLFLLRMVGDPVSNVRLKIASKLHLVAVMCYPLGSYDDVIERLCNDPDPDVRQAMREFPHRADELALQGSALAKRNDKKYTFERWMYNDCFCMSDLLASGEQLRSRRIKHADDPMGSDYDKNGLSEALSKVRGLWKRGKKKFREQRTESSGSTSQASASSPRSSAGFSMGGLTVGVPPSDEETDGGMEYAALSRTRASVRKRGTGMGRTDSGGRARNGGNGRMGIGSGTFGSDGARVGGRHDNLNRGAGSGSLYIRSNSGSDFNSSTEGFSIGMSRSENSVRNSAGGRNVADIGHAAGSSGGVGESDNTFQNGMDRHGSRLGVRRRGESTSSGEAHRQEDTSMSSVSLQELYGESSERGERLAEELGAEPKSLRLGTAIDRTAGTRGDIERGVMHGREPQHENEVEVGAAGANAVVFGGEKAKEPFMARAPADSPVSSSSWWSSS